MSEYDGDFRSSQDAGTGANNNNSVVEISDNNNSVVINSPALPFVIDEQRVTVHRVDFVNKSLFLTTELDIRVQYGYPGVRSGSIGLNCRQAAITAIRVNGETTTSFTYADPWTLSEPGEESVEIPRDNAELAKQMTVAAEATDADGNNGELWIANLTRPPIDGQLGASEEGSEAEEVTPAMEWSALTISIDYVLEQPESGIVFVLPRAGREGASNNSNESLIQRGAHVYTTSTACARDWLPCVDSQNALCRWRLEFHLPPPLIAVSCGEQISVENEQDTAVTCDRTHAFSLTLPVPASLIGFAIGAFESVVDEHMNEIQHYCPPGGISSLLEPTTNCLQTVFEFFEENLACTYPFAAYRQVFVHAPPSQILSFATLSIISAAALTQNDSIEGQITSRRLHAEAVARQYFGCVVIAEAAPSSLTSRLAASWWLVPALARYTASLYARRAFGNNEDKNWVAAENNALADFELNRLNGSALRLDIESFAFEEEPFSEMAVRKGALVLRLVEIRITHERLLHVLSVLLAKSAKREMSVLTRADFVQNVSIISGTQVGEFMNRFEGSGSIRLVARYAYSRRRSALQVNLQQQHGQISYAGPVSIAIQEMDGHFPHVVQMSGRNAAVELPIHSKPKKTRKRRVVLVSGEEVDIDLTGADIDCVILWLRVDPNYALLRANTVVHQPDYSWQFQLELDRDVCGQLEAATALKQFPTPVSRARLESAITNDQFFYRVRCAAAMSLAENLILAANNATASNGGIPVPMSAQPIISLFRRLFASRTCSQLPRPNNFANIQSYLVQQSLVEAIASCQCRDAVDFLCSLLNYNDNSRNKFSDAGYIANICKQLAKCLATSPVRANLSTSGSNNANLGPNSPPGIVLAEIVTRLNIDTLPSPTAGFLVTRSCLSAIRHLQKLGYLPNIAQFFEHYVAFSGSRRCGSVFPDLRLEAFRCLIDCILHSEDEEEATAADHYSGAVIELISKDEDLSVKFGAIEHLLEVSTKHPSFSERSRAAASHASLARLLVPEQLWNAALLAQDVRLRSRLAALFKAIHSQEAQDRVSGVGEGRVSSAGLLHNMSHEGGLSLSPPPVPKKKSKLHHHHQDKSQQPQAPVPQAVDQPWNSNPSLMSLDDEGNDDFMSYFD